MDILDLASDLKEFTEKLLGPSLEELGLIMGEKIRLLRLKSSIKIFKRAKELLKEAGISEPKPVDLKTLIPLLEYCSLENEDSDLIEKWAGLLATACSEKMIIYSYPHILNQLSPLEAQYLDRIYNYVVGRLPKEEWNIKGLTLDDLCTTFEITPGESLIYLDNLFRLGLCQPCGTESLKSMGFPVAIKQYDVFNITPLGVDFIKSCRGPKKNYVYPPDTNVDA